VVISLCDSAGEKDNHQPKGNLSAAESASAADFVVRGSGIRQLKKGHLRD
jgi:hypothetical protein